MLAAGGNSASPLEGHSGVCPGRDPNLEGLGVCTYAGANSFLPETADRAPGSFVTELF